jgi:hypothetical protein
MSEPEERGEVEREEEEPEEKPELDEDGPDPWAKATTGRDPDE